MSPDNAAPGSVDVPPLDQRVYDLIVEDMELHAGEHRPSELWDMKTLFSSEEQQRSPRFGDLMRPWVGVADKPAPPQKLDACRAFLESLGCYTTLLDQLEARGSGAPAPSVAELRTALDVGLILRHLPPSAREPIRVLEVGGGYGRVAEALLRMPGVNVKHVLVDSVPASLYYANAYLRMRLPERQIGFYYEDGADLLAADCCIVPSWRFEELEAAPFDVAVNIASMQEMTTEQVRYWIATFDRTVTLGGEIYLSNSRDFGFRHRFRYPRNWRLERMTNTPLSWSSYYPVEIFHRDQGDYRKDNAVLESGYLEKACERYRDVIARQGKELARQRARLARVRRALDS